VNKECRLRKNKDFIKTYNKGKSFSNRYFVAVIKKNYGMPLRIGFSISKKYGKAVQRNLMKRRLREIFRDCYPQLKKGYDLIIIVRKSADSLPFQEIKKNIHHLLLIAKMMKNIAKNENNSN